VMAFVKSPIAGRKGRVTMNGTGEGGLPIGWIMREEIVMALPR
jgi:hypothetical protein